MEEIDPPSRPIDREILNRSAKKEDWTKDDPSFRAGDILGDLYPWLFAIKSYLESGVSEQELITRISNKLSPTATKEHRELELDMWKVMIRHVQSWKRGPNCDSIFGAFSKGAVIEK